MSVKNILKKQTPAMKTGVVFSEPEYRGGKDENGDRAERRREATQTPAAGETAAVIRAVASVPEKEHRRGRRAVSVRTGTAEAASHHGAVTSRSETHRTVS